MQTTNNPVHVVTTSLEMLTRPHNKARPLPAATTITQAVKPTVSFYRYLYNTAGEAYAWVDRHKMSDKQLAAVIQHPNVHIYVLYAAGVPAGYAELDQRQFPDIELAYFGLLPEFVGRGYGLAFLQWVVNKAWDTRPQRLWVHTCTLDHPNALDVYQKAGFVIYHTAVSGCSKQQLFHP